MHIVKQTHGHAVPTHAFLFKPGSAVEVSFNATGFNGSWFSGTIINHLDVDSHRFLVQYHHDILVRAVVTLHQLRPLPPPETHQEFISGDEVESFHDHRWWAGHVTHDLGKERFLVFLWDLKEEMAFPKELLRTHYQWINHKWVPPTTNHDNRDRISGLPDTVLLYIMNFMNTKHAVQTCVLSKRWKDLCKGLVNLTYSNPHYYCGVESFKKFAFWILSRRDNSCSLLNLTIQFCWTEPQLLDEVIKYALFHNIQHLVMNLHSGFRPNLRSLPLLFCCPSLTSLNLCITLNYSTMVLPRFQHLPALKSLHLQAVKFFARGNDSAEPFSNCCMLKTLVLRYCSLHNDAQTLCISNSTLTSLTICGVQVDQIVLSTPNLSSFTVRGSVNHQLFSTCNLSFLEEVNIDISWDGCWDERSSITCPNIMRWLRVLANVKTMTIAWYAFQIILDEFSNPDSVRPEPPSFVRLESLKVIKHFFVNESDEKINTVVKYLLRDSPMARVDFRAGA